MVTRLVPKTTQTRIWDNRLTQQVKTTVSMLYVCMQAYSATVLTMVDDCMCITLRTNGSDNIAQTHKDFF